ncbi:6-phosphofructokinase 3 [Hibiscus syriacus]|uniref:6-phosphofructokinase 3 n=1 Tax=Hibiscus syriacus TaxID=106335 RepID=A0A6A2ZNR0_HIBSY|nr:6-phosphofructokinase 3 [Hibiscus syriacus]
MKLNWMRVPISLLFLKYPVAGITRKTVTLTVMQFDILKVAASFYLALSSCICHHPLLHSDKSKFPFVDHADHTFKIVAGAWAVQMLLVIWRAVSNWEAMNRQFTPLVTLCTGQPLLASESAIDRLDNVILEEFVLVPISLLFLKTRGWNNKKDSVTLTVMQVADFEFCFIYCLTLLCLVHTSTHFALVLKYPLVLYLALSSCICHHPLLHSDKSKFPFVDHADHTFKIVAGAWAVQMLLGYMESCQQLGGYEQLQKMKAELDEVLKNPERLILEAVHSAGYSGALANPLLASESAIDRLDNVILEEFVTENYKGSIIVLAASGIENEELLLIAEPLLADIPAGPQPKEPKSVYSTHFALVFEVPGGWNNKKDSVTLTVMQVIWRAVSNWEAMSRFICLHTLLLHPDKNKFPFANHTFNIVAEAWVVLLLLGIWRAVIKLGGYELALLEYDKHKMHCAVMPRSVRSLIESFTVVALMGYDKHKMHGVVLPHSVPSLIGPFTVVCPALLGYDKHKMHGVVLPHSVPSLIKPFRVVSPVIWRAIIKLGGYEQALLGYDKHKMHGVVLPHFVPSLVEAFTYASPSCICLHHLLLHPDKIMFPFADHADHTFKIVADAWDVQLLRGDARDLLNLSAESLNFSPITTASSIVGEWHCWGMTNIKCMALYSLIKTFTVVSPALLGYDKHKMHGVVLPHSVPSLIEAFTVGNLVIWRAVIKLEGYEQALLGYDKHKIHGVVLSHSVLSLIKPFTVVSPALLGYDKHKMHSVVLPHSISSLVEAFTDFIWRAVIKLGGYEQALLGYDKHKLHSAILLHSVPSLVEAFTDRGNDTIEYIFYFSWSLHEGFEFAQVIWRAVSKLGGYEQALLGYDKHKMHGDALLGYDKHKMHGDVLPHSLPSLIGPFTVVCQADCEVYALIPGLLHETVAEVLHRAFESAQASLFQVIWRVVIKLGGYEKALLGYDKHKMHGVVLRHFVPSVIEAFTVGNPADCEVYALIPGLLHETVAEVLHRAFESAQASLFQVIWRVVIKLGGYEKALLGYDKHKMHGVVLRHFVPSVIEAFTVGNPADCLWYMLRFPGFFVKKSVVIWRAVIKLGGYEHVCLYIKPKV